MIWSGLFAMIADLATRDIVPSENAMLKSSERVPPDDNRQRGGAATTLLETSALGETLLVRFPVARHSVRVLLVTPEMVERAVARRCVDGVLTASERAVLAALPV